MKTKGEVKRVPVVMRMREKTTTTEAPKKLIMSAEQLDELVDMAVERLREMEETEQEMKELKEDGLMILKPMAEGEIVNVDSEASLDGMKIVDFETGRI